MIILEYDTKIEKITTSWEHFCSITITLNSNKQNDIPNDVGKVKKKMKKKRKNKECLSHVRFLDMFTHECLYCIFIILKF